MASQIVVPEANYTPKSYGPFSTVLPLGDTEGYFRATNVGWPAQVRVETIFEISFDGGVTWPVLYSQTLTGGSWGTNKFTGLPVTESNLRVGLPEPTNPNRRLRGRAIVAGASIRSQLTIGSV